MRKLLSLFLAAVMVILTVPLTAATVSAATYGFYTYEVADGCATITDVDKTISGNVTLPNTLGGYPVTGIGDAITILKHVAEWQGIAIDTDAADVDASGKVDLNDAILVLRKIAGWAVDF